MPFEYIITWMADADRIEILMLAQWHIHRVFTVMGWNYDMSQIFEFYDHRYRFTREIKHPKANVRALLRYIFMIMIPLILICSLSCCVYDTFIKRHPNIDIGDKSKSKSD